MINMHWKSLKEDLSFWTKNYCAYIAVLRNSHQPLSKRVSQSVFSLYTGRRSPQKPTIFRSSSACFVCCSNSVYIDCENCTETLMYKSHPLTCCVCLCVQYSTSPFHYNSLFNLFECHLSELFSTCTHWKPVNQQLMIQQYSFLLSHCLSFFPYFCIFQCWAKRCSLSLKSP